MALRESREPAISAEWDVFVSYASEDEDAIARPLAKALAAEGLRVWFAGFTLRVGDSLREVIDHGLANSKYGIVILSPSFFAKKWPKRELAGLLARDEPDRIVLPVWHEVDLNAVRRNSPILADRIGIPTDSGISVVIRELLRAMNLPFHGPQLTGTWYGRTGRMRLFQIGDSLEKGTVPSTSRISYRLCRVA